MPVVPKRWKSHGINGKRDELLALLVSGIPTGVEYTPQKMKLNK
jgi:hypothetical protein